MLRPLSLARALLAGMETPTSIGVGNGSGAAAGGPPSIVRRSTAATDESGAQHDERLLELLL